MLRRDWFWKIKRKIRKWQSTSRSSHLAQVIQMHNRITGQQSSAVSLGCCGTSSSAPTNYQACYPTLVYCIKFPRRDFIKLQRNADERCATHLWPFCILEAPGFAGIHCVSIFRIERAADASSSKEREKEDDEDEAWQGEYGRGLGYSSSQNSVTLIDLTSIGGNRNEYEVRIHNKLPNCRSWSKTKLELVVISNSLYGRNMNPHKHIELHGRRN